MCKMECDTDEEKHTSTFGEEQNNDKKKNAGTFGEEGRGEEI
jgi:hypothetical protein